MLSVLTGMLGLAGLRGWEKSKRIANEKDFDYCLEMLLHHEGGFTADKFDPGNDGDGYGNQGSPKLGVTAKVYACIHGPASADC